MLKKTGVFVLSAIGSFQFMVLTFLAMMLFPRKYNFATDPFSSLGFHDANWAIRYFQKGEIAALPSLYSPYIFTITLIIAALSIFPLMVILPTFFKDKKNTKTLSLIGSFLGICALPFLALIAVPADVSKLSFTVHYIAAVAFFVLFSCMILFSSLAIINSNKYHSIFGLIGLFIFLNGLLHALMPFFITSWTLNVMHQKITVYSFIIWCLINQIYIIKHFRK